MLKYWFLYRRDIKQTLILSLPIIVGQLGNILMGLFDNAMVGAIEPVEYGAMAVAAAGVSNALFFLVTVLGFGTMMAVSTLVSICKAKDDNYGCAEYLKYSIVAAFLITVVLTGVLLLTVYYFDVFVEGKEIQVLGKQYLLIITTSTFPLLAGLAVKNFADGLSFTKPAMVVTLLGVVLNIFLNWLFIYGNWGLPAWGLQGAGYATVLSRIFIFVVLLVYVYRSKLFVQYRRVSKGINLSSTHLKEIFKIGLPSGMQYFFEVGAFSVANVLTTRIGPFQSAAHQIALYLAAVSYMISTGFSAGGSIRVGTAFSEGNLRNIKRAGYSALFLVTATMAVTATIFIIFNTALPALFNKHPVVMEYTASLLLIAALFQFSDGAQAVGLGILRGLRDVRYPTIATLFSYWVIGLPLAYVCAFTLHMNVQGVWYGLTAGLTLAAVFLTRRFWVLTTKKKLF
jgi:multidrug resistance protein, MATE family